MIYRTAMFLFAFSASQPKQNVTRWARLQRSGGEPLLLIVKKAMKLLHRLLSYIDYTFITSFRPFRRPSAWREPDFPLFCR